MWEFIKSYLSGMLKNPVPMQDREIEMMRPTPQEYRDTPSIYATRGYTPDEFRERAMSMIPQMFMSSRNPMHLRQLVNLPRGAPTRTPNEVYVEDLLSKQREANRQRMIQEFQDILDRRIPR